MKEQLTVLCCGTTTVSFGIKKVMFRKASGWKKMINRRIGF